jgi:hypothetical protein
MDPSTVTASESRPRRPGSTRAWLLPRGRDCRTRLPTGLPVRCCWWEVLTGKQAKLYAQDQIGVDLTKVAGGKTYSQISAEWIAGGMKNTTLAAERTTLFMGETLNGLLLNAWGWSVIGSIATLAGFILILLGGVLFLLPLANWQVNLRGRRVR